MRVASKMESYDCEVTALAIKLTDGSEVFRVDVCRVGDENPVTVSFSRDDAAALRCAQAIIDAIKAAA